MNLFLAVSYVILWLLVVLLFVALFALYNHFGNLYLVSRENRVAQGQPAGDFVRAFEAESVDGTPAFMPADGPTVLLFLSTTCNICKVLLDGLDPLRSSHPSVSVVLICAGRQNMVRAWAGNMSEKVTVIADPHARIRRLYDVDITPFAIAVGADYRVRQCGIVNNYEGLESAAKYAEGDSVASEVMA